MQRQMMKSKIHRALVTDADINYEGSITIDQELMEKADLMEFEKVLVVDINNGERFETYTITGERGSGVICLNGAAARLVQLGDRVIIMSFCIMTDEELANFKSITVLLDEKNRIKDII